MWKTILSSLYLKQFLDDWRSYITHILFVIPDNISAASLLMCLYLLQPFSQRGVIGEQCTAANQLIDR